MKTRLLFILVVFAALTAFKSYNHKKADRLIKKVVSIKRPQDSSAYTYMKDGRIATYNSYWSEMWQTFEYDGKKVIEQGDGPATGHPYTNTYYLNRDGRADSMIRVSDSMTFCIYFKYDKDGYRVEEHSGCDTKVLERRRVIKDGNVVKQIFYENDEEVEAGYFDYHLNQPNQPSMFGEELLGYTFRGKDSKNLLKRVVLVRSNNDTVLVNIPSYHFDDKGRISTLAIYGKAGSMADSLVYSY